MNKHVCYKILPEIHLFVEYYSGQIFLEDLIHVKKREIKDKDYDPLFNAIGDLRDAEFILSVPEIIEYSNYVKSASKVSGKRNTAILTRTPGQVAKSSIYQMQGRALPMNFKIVSTLEAALEWVGLSNEYSGYIEVTIRDMKDDKTLTFQ